MYHREAKTSNTTPQLATDKQIIRSVIVLNPISTETDSNVSLPWILIAMNNLITSKYKKSVEKKREEV